jgi:hypothetical protein
MSGTDRGWLAIVKGGVRLGVSVPAGAMVNADTESALSLAVASRPRGLNATECG